MSTTDATTDAGNNAPQQNELLWVELGERRYPILIGQDIGAELAQALRDADAAGGKSVTVADANLQNCAAQSAACAALLPAQAPVLDIRIEGEKAKSLEMLGAIYDQLARNKVGRDGRLVAIGGGVTGDLAGFAAASYLRGIDFYQVPTTLLAMVDSSVGGKTGINISAGKNLVGAFWQPKAVFISTGCLATLPAREFAAGMAEVIKYGMLFDADFFAALEAHCHSGQRLAWNHPALPAVIRRCCEIKAQIVGEDERETSKDGGRALLNLGHTFAHAIENAAGYGTYLHGEAVAIGLLMAARLSEELTARKEPGYNFTAADTARTRALLAAYDLPTALGQPLGATGSTHRANGAASAAAAQPVTAPATAPVTPPALSLEALRQAMGRDKKVKAGTIRFVAMQELGRAVTTNGIDSELIDALWREFGAQG